MTDVSVKLCVDCKHYEPPATAYDPTGFCHRPSLEPQFSLVTGEEITPEFANMQRQEYDPEMLVRFGAEAQPTCGRDARFFEAGMRPDGMSDKTIDRLVAELDRLKETTARLHARIEAYAAAYGGRDEHLH